MNVKEKRLTYAGVVLALVMALAGLFVPAARGGVFQPQAVRERIAINARDDSYIYAGADIRWYSDFDKATEVARIDGAGGAQFAVPTTVATATPGVLINDYHPGRSFEIQDAATPVFYVDDGGEITLGGAFVAGSTIDLQGNISSSAGAITMTDILLVDGAADAVQITAQGYTTQTSPILTIEQSDGTDKLTVTDNGDTWIAGTLGVEGNTAFTGTLTASSTSDLRGNISDGGGTLTIADDVLIDGQADAVQLTVQGYTTQTNPILTIEETGGTDKCTITSNGDLWNAGTLGVGGAGTFTGTLTSSGAFVASSTSDLQGSIADSGGTLTIADDLAITGQADAVQLTATGYQTQTNPILTIEDSTNADKFTVDATGDVVAAGTLDVTGNTHVSGTVQIGSNYPLEFASAGRILYVGTTDAFTGTTTVVSATHGCTTAALLALCQMQDPDDDGGDAFICIGSVSGTEVTLTAIDTAGDTATEADTVADYMIIGY